MRFQQKYLIHIKTEDTKKKNPNDEVNIKILQALDESKNDIIAANKALEAFDIIWKCDDFEFKTNKDKNYKRNRT